MLEIFHFIPLKYPKENTQLLPFLSLSEYRFLLSQSDCNIIRGENSLIDAILSRKPFLWDIYKEKNMAHLEKIEDFILFLEQYNF